MKVFVWKRVEGLTESYHDGGGLVVVARDLEQARVSVRAGYHSSEACESRLRCVLLHKEPPGLGDPDRVYEIGEAATAEVMVFPDQGCC